MLNKITTTLHQIIAISLIVLISLLAFIFEKELISTLVFERNSIAQGEFWRLFTGHFFHANLNHLLFNLGGLVLIWALHGQYYKTQELVTFFVFSILFTSVCIYFFSPTIGSYVGLSGVLHGLFIWGVIYDIRKRVPGGYLLLTGILGKIVYEQIYGSEENIRVLISAPIAVDAHLWGAASGLLFALLVWLQQSMKLQKKD